MIRTSVLLGLGYTPDCYGQQNPCTENMKAKLLGKTPSATMVSYCNDYTTACGQGGDAVAAQQSVDKVNSGAIVPSTKAGVVMTTAGGAQYRDTGRVPGSSSSAGASTSSSSARLAELKACTDKLKSGGFGFFKQGQQYVQQNAAAYAQMQACQKAVSLKYSGAGAKAAGIVPIANVGGLPTTGCSGAGCDDTPVVDPATGQTIDPNTGLPVSTGVMDWMSNNASTLGIGALVLVGGIILWKLI